MVQVKYEEEQKDHIPCTPADVMHEERPTRPGAQRPPVKWGLLHLDAGLDPPTAPMTGLGRAGFPRRESPGLGLGGSRATARAAVRGQSALV